jgi:ribulose-phosphate 3-epimerase
VVTATSPGLAPVEIAPSILSADFARLGEQVHEALAAGARRIHVDVMDGRFVPNITVGPLVVEALRPLAAQFGATLEAHLMIVEPERYLADFVNAGAGIVIVHGETCPHLHRTVQRIRELGAKAGVALNPATPLAALDEILADVDQALVMTVNPGFGGQAFIPASLGKIARLCRSLAAAGLERLAIEVDGGINAATIGAVADAGATIAVAGTAVFGGPSSVAENIQRLRDAARRGAWRAPQAIGMASL